MARAEGGEFLLRIEDIDRSRARPEWEELIYDDLRWLGLSWDGPVMRQSERAKAYLTALEDLWMRGLLFRCTCNRKDLAAAAAAPQEGIPILGPDGIVYPGTCREGPRGPNVPFPNGAVLRLDMTRALRIARIVDARGGLAFTETGAGPEGETGGVVNSAAQMVTGVGDIVLARRDMGTSYHLSVAIDDAGQGITHVLRGQDLFGATPIHVLLQRLLGLPTPIYHHHRLIRDEAGKRLAKRDDARAIRTYRTDGASPADIRSMVGL